MKKSNVALLAAAGVAVAAVLGLWWQLSEPRLQTKAILAGYAGGAVPESVSITYPPDGAVFPPEIAPPTFRWKEGRCNGWLVQIRFEAGEPFVTTCDSPHWTPRRREWESIKSRSRERPAAVTIVGVDRRNQQQPLAAGSIAIRTSNDEVGAPLFYREVILPFSEAVRDPSRLRWRFGYIAAEEPPPVVLEGLPVCGNCHSFSRDGSILGMDVDYANDKGSYAVAPVRPDTVLDARRIITWSDYHPEDGVPTFGLLSQVSPDGRYVVSTVKDRSVFVARPNLAFSQLFFPIKGILVVYDRQTGKYQALPGADDPHFVQSNPSWSPDGKTIVFARAEAYELPGLSGADVLLSPAQCAEFLEGNKSFRFDLYRVPFNEGRGGIAQPLAGASGNGLSNYFAKYSPDGRWIVFCRAKSFMLLQPGSELYILPAEGGEPRRLECNRGRMNSWHSWSPNSRWLVFSSKDESPYTQLFLSHIDQRGHASPPIALERFTAPDRAANIPEFVHAGPDAIRQIQTDFVNEQSYVRVAAQALQNSDPATAEKAARRALEMNENSAQALANLGAAKMCQGQADEARALFERARQIDPGLREIYFNLAVLALDAADYRQAVDYYRQGLEIDPDQYQGQLDLGCILLLHLHRPAEAVGPLSEAVRLMPAEPQGRFHLATALAAVDRPAEAAEQLREVLKVTPEDPITLCTLAALLTDAHDPALRDADEAASLAERACRATNYSELAPLATLAAAHAAAGRYAEAIPPAQRALQMLRAMGNEGEARAVAARLQAYKARLQQGPAGP